MKRLFKSAVVLIFAFVFSMGAFAFNSNYKNNLLNIDFIQSQNENVSISMCFEKPYESAIKVNYKGENQYNILLPETYHSVTSAHYADAPNVKSVDVKLVPAFDQTIGSGYTKITIMTEKPAVFTVQTKASTAQTLAGSDLTKVLSETKTAQTIQPVQKTQTAQTQTKPATVAQTPQPASSKTTALPASKPVQTAVTKTAATTTAKTVQQPKTAQTTPQKASTKPAAPEKPVQKPVTAKPQQSVTPAKTAELPKKQTAQDEQLAQTPPAPAEQLTEQPKNETPEQITPTQKESPTASSKTVWINKTVAKLTLIIALPLLLLLWLLKLFNKNDTGTLNLYNESIENTEKSTKMSNEENKDENYSSIPVEGTIDGSLSWQEKYRLLKESEEQAKLKQEEEKHSEISNEIDNIYGHASDKTQEIYPFEEEISDDEITFEDVLNLDETDFVDNIENEESFIEMSEEILNETEYEEEYEEDKTVSFEDFIQEQETENIPRPEIEAEPETKPDETAVMAESVFEPELQFNPEEEQQVEPLHEEEIEQTPEYTGNTTATSPISGEPVLINESKISKTKGFYLIKYDTETALVGYIKDKIFVLSTFEDSDQTFVQTRLNEKKQGKEIYIVRSNNYKSLVEVSKDEMKTVIEL